MEKEHQPDSMATITMKADYPPSEVYSASEPPPAYRQRVSNSVQIARIAAVTVVAASCILGAFILASSWVAARASCHQLEQLDAMLDKELALEGKNYGNDAFMPAEEPLPLGNAHALLGVPPPSSTAAPAPAHTDALHHAETKLDEDKLQKVDEDKKSSDSDESSESESSGEEEDELEGLGSMMKLPIQFDLDDLAGAFLANSNQKGRMNCVVERRRSEPLQRFPFSILGGLAPARDHAERIAIICHGSDEPRGLVFPEAQSQVFAFPLSGPARLPLRPAAPAPAAPAPAMQHRAQPFPLPLPWESSEEQTAPREMRIHVQRVIAIPAPRNMSPMLDNMPFPPPQHTQNTQQPEQATVMHQFVPQPAPTQELEQPEVQKVEMEGMGGALPWGLTAEELRDIQRVAEQGPRQQIDNDMQEVKAIVNTIAAAAEAEAAEQQRAELQQRDQLEQREHMEQQQRAELQQRDQLEQREHMEQQQRAELQQREHGERAPRTLLLPQELPAEDRPHYMQPRSVRSVDALTANKRVQRCACNCH